MGKLKTIDFFKAVVLFAVIGVGIYLGQRVANDDVVKNVVQNLGYLGVFFIAYGSGFNLVVPIPAVTFMPAFTAAGFGFWPTVSVMAFGLTAADLTAFLIGRAGRGVQNAPITGWVAKIEKLQGSNPHARWMILFLYASFFPLPNEVLLLPMGYLGVRLRDVAAPVLLGNFIFNVVASGGILTISNLL